jgi:hypothetical protein
MLPPFSLLMEYWFTEDGINGLRRLCWPCGGSQHRARGENGLKAGSSLAGRKRTPSNPKLRLKEETFIIKPIGRLGTAYLALLAPDLHPTFDASCDGGNKYDISGGYNANLCMPLPQCQNLPFINLSLNCRGRMEKRFRR